MNELECECSHTIECNSFQLACCGVSSDQDTRKPHLTTCKTANINFVSLVGDSMNSGWTCLSHLSASSTASGIQTQLTPRIKENSFLILLGESLSSESNASCLCRCLHPIALAKPHWHGWCQSMWCSRALFLLMVNLMPNNSMHIHTSTNCSLAGISNSDYLLLSGCHITNSTKFMCCVRNECSLRMSSLPFLCLPVWLLWSRFGVYKFWANSS